MRQYIWIEDGAGIVVIARADDSRKVRTKLKTKYKEMLDAGVVSPKLYDRVMNLVTGRGNLKESVSVDGNLKFEGFTIFVKGDRNTYEWPTGL